MNDTVYVVVTKNGFDRVMKRMGFNLNAGEKAFRLDLEVPDDAFKPPPMPTVRMLIPKEALIQEITATVDGVAIEGGE